MPNLKSAKKRAKQSQVRQDRNYSVRSKVHTQIKNIETLVKDKKTDEAEKSLPTAYREIDMAVKKNIYHKNNGARKKSYVSRLVKNAKA